jgi:hypothetical protein
MDSLFPILGGTQRNLNVDPKIETRDDAMVQIYEHDLLVTAVSQLHSFFLLSTHHINILKYA